MENVQNLFICLDRSIFKYSNLHANAISEVKAVIQNYDLSKEEFTILTKFIEVSNQLLIIVNSYCQKGIDEGLEVFKIRLNSFKHPVTNILSSKICHVA